MRSRLCLAPFVFVPLLLVGAGCPRGGAAPPPETAEPEPAVKVRPPNPRVFAPLEHVLAGVTLPFVIDRYGEASSSSCVVASGEPVVGSADGEAVAEIGEQKRAVTKVLAGWLSDKIAPAAVSDRVISGWTITPEGLVALEAPGADIRFAEDAGCIDAETGRPAGGGRVVVALYGAKALRIESPTPIGRATADLIRDRTKAAGLEFETGDLIDYELVTDGEGAPQKGPEGEKLYRSPDGGVASERDIVLPEKQTLESWVVRSEEPIFFGFREVSELQWRAEVRAETCDVNLVWGDPTFRQAECSSRPDAGFAAAEKAGRVEVRIKVGGDVRTELMDYDEERRVQIGDRLLLWISPGRIEEGVLIRLNSVELRPAP